MAKTHATLKNDVRIATETGRKVFPPMEADLIAELIRRGLPYYETAISPEFFASMNHFAHDVGILSGWPSYDRVFAAEGRV